LVVVALLGSSKDHDHPKVIIATGLMLVAAPVRDGP
jgi:hypothetical protein